jgi:hypothetical protein
MIKSSDRYFRGNGEASRKEISSIIVEKDKGLLEVMVLDKLIAKDLPIASVRKLIGTSS